MESTSLLQLRGKAAWPRLPAGQDLGHPATYDRIGSGYQETRRPDPRLARFILRERDSATTVVNVGAGTGSYEPADRLVVAVEPSTVMIRQRRPTSAPAIQACAEALPFPDDTFEAAMAVLTVHHWADQRAGMNELSRVATKRIVILTWDPSSEGFWLMTDYFPQFLEADRKRLPEIEHLLSFLQDGSVLTVPIPHDCMDGFLGSYWRRPASYLDSGVRSSISSFASCQDLSPLRQLEEDLSTGKWRRRYRYLLDMEEIDIGYRLVVGRPGRGST